MPNIDFGDPINFSPKGPAKPSTTGPSLDMGRARVANTSIPREPAHTATDFGPIFRRPQSPSEQAGVEGAPQTNLPPGAIQQAPLPPEKSKGGRLIFAIIAVIGVFILIVIGYFVLTSLGNNSNKQNTPQNTTNQTSNTTTNSTGVLNTTNSVTVADPTADPDGDALTNQEEAKYGTDPNNPDSDADGFKDGAEVEKGYNPLGTGTLPNPQP